MKFGDKRRAINKIKSRDIITRLRELQIEQEELLIEQENLISELEGRRVTPTQFEKDPRLIIGSTVVMKSRGRYQGEIGSVVKIGKARATVEILKYGIVDRTTRSFKNLQVLETPDE